MKAADLKVLTILASGKQLRTQAALALSDVALWKQAAGKQILSDFFYDCAVKTGVDPNIGATSVIINSGAGVPVTNSAGAAIATATATVAGGILTGAALPSSVAGVVHNGTYAVANVSGPNTASGVATVGSGVLTRLTLGANSCLLNSTVKVAVGTVSGSGTFGTFTIAGGVITGIVLSAS